MAPSPFDHSLSFVLWESLSEHGSATFRLFFCGLVLNHIPMLDQDSILDANYVRRNPVHWQAEVRKSSVGDHKISVGHDRSRFIFRRWRKALYQVKQALTTGNNVSAMLNVFR